ncbi:MAG: 3-keto-disaccharide hydrolase [Thermoguttaceae bacterium]
MKKTVLTLLLLALLTPFALCEDNVLSEDDRENGWEVIFDGKTLDGWKANEPIEDGWVVKEGCIVGGGPKNHLFFMEELGDFELKIDCKVNRGGNSGLYFHVPKFEPNWPVKGFELQINCSHSDPVKTGSLYNIIKMLKAPHGNDEWFTYHISVKGDTLTVRVNGQVLYIYVDPVEKAAQGAEQGEITEATKRIRQRGHIALQQHDPKTVPQFKNVFLKKL